MALITEIRTLAKPDYEALDISDPEADAVDSEALEDARAHVVASSGYHVYVHSLQRDIKVEVVIRVWDGPQPTPGQSVSGFVRLALESENGVLMVNQFTSGPAGEMSLPRPGVYEGYASWSGREEVVAYRDSVVRQLTSDWSVEDMRQAWERCPVPERYVLDLWYVRESSAGDEDDEL
ncbi:hypothetical protein ACFP1Z_23930 [Streptomyces gamaensis]|uniref:Uncharacterized protein n=1 Tax=Streptomyces gamaensis TaxID=1763542 RepID=A0ABW0Z327_9ACTN